MSNPSPQRDADQARSNLRALLWPRLTPASVKWLALQEGVGPQALKAALAELNQHVSRQGLIKEFAARADARVEGVWGPLAVGEWSVADAARVFLVSLAAEHELETYGVLFALYDQGGTELKVATLRALNFVSPDAPERGLQLVADAGRTYLPALLSAAWPGNPFSALHLSDHDYRKAVLKAFFCDVSVEGFVGLEQRADPELARSLCEYVDERLAAGRSVPRAIWPLAALHPRPGLVARLIGMLEHPDSEQRLSAARALTNARDPRALTFVTERRERETEEPVAAALDRCAQALAGASS